MQTWTSSFLQTSLEFFSVRRLGSVLQLKNIKKIFKINGQKEQRKATLLKEVSGLCASEHGLASYHSAPSFNLFDLMSFTKLSLTTNTGVASHLRAKEPYMNQNKAISLCAALTIKEKSWGSSITE